MKVSNKTLLETLNRVANTEDGRIVLAAVMDQSGWLRTYKSDNPVETHAMAVRRAVWGAMRRHIKNEHLKAIEYDYEFVETE